MNESHLKLEFYPLNFCASSCNLKCALGYGKVVILLIIQDSLAGAQNAKLRTKLDFSIFIIFTQDFLAHCLQVVADELRWKDILITIWVWLTSKVYSTGTESKMKLQCGEIK